MKEVGQIADFTCPDCLSNMEIINTEVGQERYNIGEGVQLAVKVRVTARCTKEECSRVYSEVEYP